MNALEPFVFLYITEKCQVRCKHCYVGERLDRGLEMTPEQVRSILTQLRIAHGHYKVYLLGGEPFLHPKLADILRICKDLEYLTVVTTNGLFDLDLYDTLPLNLVNSLSFSCDGGSAASHEQVRGKNTFEPLLRNAREAVRRGLQTRIICTVTQLNRHDCLNVVAIAKDVGVDMVSYHYFSPIGLGARRPHIALSPEEWMAFCTEVTQLPANGVWVYVPPTFCRPEELAYYEKKGYKGCTARWLERIAVFPDGKAYLCSVFFDTNFNFADFDFAQNRLTVKRDGKNELDIVMRIPEGCKGCPVSSACKGGCNAYGALPNGFPRVFTNDNCSRSIVPVCPLWSTTLTDSGVPTQLIQDLR